MSHEIALILSFVLGTLTIIAFTGMLSAIVLTWLPVERDEIPSLKVLRENLRMAVICLALFFLLGLGLIYTLGII
ncbi:MAG: hypothetical protein Q7R54_00165 [bacterium]|nr:hypothetical protein [bacterium]